MALSVFGVEHGTVSKSAHHIANLKTVGHLVREAQASGHPQKLRNAQKVYKFAVRDARQAGVHENDITGALGQINN